VITSKIKLQTPNLWWIESSRWLWKVCSDWVAEGYVQEKQGDGEYCFRKWQDPFP